MTIGLDTSVLVRLLTGEPRDLALAALHYLMEHIQAGDRVQVADWVLAETYYALQHHYGVPKREAIGALRDFMTGAEVEGTGAAEAVLQTPHLASAKPGFVDRVIHAGYLRSGAERVVTFEKAARKLGDVIVLSA